jgi:hypothetical protein
MLLWEDGVTDLFTIVMTNGGWLNGVTPTLQILISEKDEK